MKSAYKRLRRMLRLVWGRAWWLRSLVISSLEKKRARNFLRENQENLVFVMGTGRSGTQLISNLLDLSGNAVIFHEPNFNEDVSCMDAFRHNDELVRKYWSCFRSIEVYKRWMKSPSAHIYGEVNGTIRYQAEAIKHIFPLSKMFLVARDGRGVIRSVMGWDKFYSKNSKGAYALKPLQNDPYYSGWDSMSRFEKMCWSWMDTNEYLMKYIPHEYWIRLEDITSDYNYFTSQFADKLCMSVSEEEWNKIVNKKSINSTSKYLFPEWDEWPQNHKDDFIRICGETMRRLGYDF